MNAPIMINLNNSLKRPIAAAVLAALVLTGCATRDKEDIRKDDALSLIHI